MDEKPYIAFTPATQPELGLTNSRAEYKDQLLRKKVADYKRGIVRNARTKGKRLGILARRYAAWL